MVLIASLVMKPGYFELLVARIVGLLIALQVDLSPIEIALVWPKLGWPEFPEVMNQSSPHKAVPATTNKDPEFMSQDIPEIRKKSHTTSR
jgi:hypothetical protein